MPSQAPVTPNLQSAAGLQRSLCLALSHVGFDAATSDALESFSIAVETYFESFVQELKRISITSRREQPTPADFELTLRYFNLALSSLKPHLKTPIPFIRLSPSYSDSLADADGALYDLPPLSKELGDQSDKNRLTHIPASFPDFPSRHTYRHTIDAAADENPNRVRENAAKAAKEGEDALRKLVRATKMRKQKEVQSLVERDDQSMERYRLWGYVMRGQLFSQDHANEAELANHCMIVNADAPYMRRDVPSRDKPTYEPLFNQSTNMINPKPSQSQEVFNGQISKHTAPYG